MVSFADDDEAFAEVYRRWFAAKHDHLDFYFHGLGNGVVSRSFTHGYVALDLHGRDHTEPARASGPLPAHTVLARHRRTIVRGAAGAGKSTMLRWLGVDEERLRGSALHGRPAVPLLIELADHPTGRLPELADLVGFRPRSRMPVNWLDRMLADGRIVLLLDGLDEVQPSCRDNVEQWALDHLSAHPDTRCMITTRPQVVAEQWWVDRGFVRFDLPPMTQENVEDYVRGWHQVARTVIPPVTVVTPEALDRNERDLVALLRQRSALQEVGSNPLLCGLLCMLHLQQKRLSDDRTEIYESALHLLLDRRPRLRRPQEAGADTAVDPLTDELARGEKLKLLQRIAKWMLETRSHSVERDTFLARVTTAKGGLRSVHHVDPDRVVVYLAQHSGVMREHMKNDEDPDRDAAPAPDSVRFVHRTFRDYLAARELVEENGLGQLLANADRPDWNDVVLLAGAVARRGEREYLANELIKRADREQKPEDAERLNLLAAAIVRQSWSLPPADLDRSTQAIYERLIPPRSTAAAELLAAAGPWVVELLPRSGHPLQPRQRALVVRVLAIIAARSPDLGVIRRIQDLVSSDPAAVQALMIPWGREGDYESYARDVLGRLDLSGAEVRLTSFRQVDLVHLIPSITWLSLTGDLRDLVSVGHLPRLHRLLVSENGVTDLSGLRATRSLQELELRNCRTPGGTPVDLAPLASVGLRRLELLGFTSNVGLHGLGNARVSEVVLAGSVLGGLADWPADLRVDNVVLDSREALPLRALRAVRTLTFPRRLPAPSEVTELNILVDRGELRRLVLGELPPGAPPAVDGLDSRVVVTVLPDRSDGVGPVNYPRPT